MSELQCVATLKIHDGKLDEFKRLAAKCAELLRRSAATACFSALRSRRVRLSADLGKCVIFGRCGPTFRSVGSAYGSISKSVSLSRGKKNGKRGNFRDNGEQNHSQDRFLVKRSNGRAPRKRDPDNEDKAERRSISLIHYYEDEL
jgi:hypothetical protein